MSLKSQAETIEQERAEIERLTAAEAEQLQQTNVVLGEAAAALNMANNNSDEEIGESLADIQGLLDKVPAPDAAPWDHPGWKSWTPTISTAWHRLRVGSLIEQRTGADLGPYWVPFVGRTGPIVISTSGVQGASSGEALLQSLLVRASAMLPHHATLHLLDPAGGGRAFPMGRDLPSVKRASSDLRRDLDDVSGSIRRIIDTYLDATTPTFHQLDEAVRLSEHFQLVFAADYPNRYDSRAIEELQFLAETGPAAGVYLVMHHNTDHATQGGLERTPLSNASIIDLASPPSISVGGIPATVRFDTAPAADRQSLIASTLSSAQPKDLGVSWTSLAGFDADDWWSEHSAERIETSIGSAGVASNLGVTFGVDRENKPVAHGIVAAGTGGGKSSLFHGLITGMACRYSPEELRLYLVDGKYGTEMAAYRNLPHAEVVSLNTEAELARSVLHELVDEMDRRNVLFQREGVPGLKEYRAGGHHMPRILLVVDEYQQFFEGDPDSSASDVLLKLSSQGRSAGIHLLMGSQSFSVKALRNRDEIFGNIHLRIAMQLTGDAVLGLTEFGPAGRKMIQSTCDRPGKLVINSRGGDDAGNKAGRVALLEAVDRDNIVSKLADKAKAAGIDSTPTVFNGDRQPVLRDNRMISSLLERRSELSAGGIQKLARLDTADGGLGIPDWLNGERPIFMCAGREFSVNGYATFAARRRPGENALVVGQDGSVRVGLLSTLAVSACAAHDPSGLSLVILDRSVPETEWHGVLPNAVTAVAADRERSVRTETGDAGVLEAIRDLDGELTKRQELPEDQMLAQPSVLVIATDLDRVVGLNHVEDAYGSEPSEDGIKLARVLAGGPLVGVHLVMAATGVKALLRVVTRQALTNSRYRLSQQVSEDDSFDFLQAIHASRVERPGEGLRAMVFADIQAGRFGRFLPHLVSDSRNEDGSDDLVTDLAALATRFEGAGPWE